MKFLYSLAFSLLFFINSARCQQITGTWECMMDKEQYLQLNIVQGNGKLCGYSWDFVVNDRNSFCKAFFEAWYDENTDRWVFVGQQFIENSKGHELMVMRLRLVKENGAYTLKGTVNLKNALSRLFDMGGDSIELKRVSPKPAIMYPFMQDCLEEAKKARDSAKKTVDTRNEKKLPAPPYLNTNPTAKKAPQKAPAPQAKKPPAVKPPVKKPVPQKAPQPLVKKAPAVQPPVKKPLPAEMPPPQKKPETVKNSTSAEIEKQVNRMGERKRSELSRLTVNVKHIELKVYDNGEIDGDTVSIFYNGRLLVNKQRLSDKPIVIPLELDDNTTIHEITMFAENLGSIPPNTALIVVTAGDKRYELRSSATLKTNAVLVFEYRPKTL